MDFLKYDEEIEESNRGIGGLDHSIKATKEVYKVNGEDISLLEKRLNAITKRLNQPQFDFSIETENSIEELNALIDLQFPNDGKKTSKDKAFVLQSTDYLVAALAGGIAVALDFLVVRIPKDSTIVRNRMKLNQEGSSLTKYFRSLGVDENGKTWQWIQTLEKNFKVPYDKSIDATISGLCPKTHRFHSLAHDPSLAGFIWGVKDIIQGTFSYIDRNGILHVEKIANKADFHKVFTAPIYWFAHIISDVLTKAGVPIPYMSYLQLLQFGSFGDKQRTIADVARYMYLNGYDLRHLLTMSTTVASIEVIIRIYLFLLSERKESNKQYDLISEREYGKIKNNIKLRRILFIAYATATCGNIAKICVNKGNPLAVNLPIWIGMIKESLIQTGIQFRETKKYEETIENRHLIDENFEYLLLLLEKS